MDLDLAAIALRLLICQLLCLCFGGESGAEAVGKCPELATHVASNRNAGCQALP